MKLFSVFTLLIVMLFISDNTYAGHTRKMYIADRLVSCGDEIVSDCMLVKSKKKEEWQNFSGKIDGFQYEEGYDYLLRLKSNEDGSFSLKKILKKKKTTYDPAERMDKKKWYLYYLHDDSNYIKLMDTTQVFMAINRAAHSVSGRGVCNNFTGTFHTEGHQITFGPMAMTRMACKGNILENIVGQMFSQMKTFKVVGNTLTLYGNGQYLMRFKTRKKE